MSIKVTTSTTKVQIQPKKENLSSPVEKYVVVDISESEGSNDSIKERKPRDLNSIILSSKNLTSAGKDGSKTYTTSKVSTATSANSQFATISPESGKSNSGKGKGVTDSKNSSSTLAELPKLSSDPLTSTSKYTAYKNVQGIDKLKPEILFALNMLPLYMSDEVMTSAGKYFSTQTYMRNLKVRILENTVQMYKDSISTRRNVSESNFFKSINNLWSHIEFLYRIVDNLDAMKESLNVSRITNDIDIEAISSYMMNSFTTDDESQQESSTSNSSENFQIFSAKFLKENKGESKTAPIPKLSDDLGASVFLPTYQKYSTNRNLADILGFYGYKKEVYSTFNSSKVWGQTLLMIRNILVAGSSHTRNFQKMSTYLNDSSKTNVVGNLEYDNLSINLKKSDLNSKSIQQVVDSKDSIDNSFVGDIESLFTSLSDETLYNSTTTPELISDYVSFISRELRYGGLTDSNPTATLQNSFNFNLIIRNDSVGNQVIFDSIFGVKTGNQFVVYGEENKSNPGGSLWGLSHSTPSTNTLVATLEDSYIKTSENGTYTPGSEFYVESIFDSLDSGEFRLDRLKTLKSAISNLYSTTVSLFKSGNLMSRYDSKGGTDKSYISDPEMFIQKILSDLIDFSSGRLKGDYLNDNWIPLFSFASSRPRLQAYLFLIVLLEMNTSQLVDEETNTSEKKYVTKLISKMVNYIFFEEDSNSLGIQDFSSVPDQIAQASLNPSQPHKEGLTNVYSRATFRGNLYSSHQHTYSPFLETVMKTITSFIEIATHDVDVKIQSNKVPIYGTETIQIKKTKYSNLSDLVSVAVIFKMMCNIADQFCENKIRGKSKDKFYENSPVQPEVLFSTYEDHTFKNAFFNCVDNVKKERSMVRESLLTLMGSILTMQKAFESGYNYVTTDTNRARAAALFKVIDDPKLFGFLLNRSQLKIVSVDSLELKNKAAKTVESDQISKILECNPCSPEFLRCIDAVFRSDQYKFDKGFNKKILSIGIPNGLSASLESVSTRNENDQRLNLENDIIKIKVYKTDLEHPDIVFNPNEFLFELSRFTIDEPSYIKPLTNESQLNDVFKSVPTRDVNSFNDASNIIAEYGKDLESKFMMLVTNSGEKKFKTRTPFSSKKYSFLSDDQKKEIIQNHVMSFIISLYVKILTGIELNERRFVFSSNKIISVGTGMLSSEVKNEMINIATQTASSVSRSRLSNNNKNDGSFFTSVSEIEIQSQLGVKHDSPSSTLSLSTTSKTTSANGQYASKIDASKIVSDTEIKNMESDENIVDYIVATIETISDIDSIVTTYTNELSLMKKYLYPRKFERVFNIVVDPDDFTINEVETIKTDSGRIALKNLLNRGLISGGSSINSNYSEVFSSKLSGSSNSKIMTKEKRDGDFSFEKYFVVIESVR